MPLTTAGRNFLAAAIINSGPPTFFDNSNAHIGVGDSTTAFNAAQTDLQAATNKLRKAMMSTFPTLATNVITFKSSFGSSEGNFAWEEVSVFNASSSGTMLSRVVSSQGTKSSGATWEITLALTITVS